MASAGLRGRGDDLDVADRILSAAQRAAGLAHTTPGIDAQPLEDRLGQRDRPAQRNARNRRAAESGSARRNRLLDRFARGPRRPRIGSIGDGGAQVGRQT